MSLRKKKKYDILKQKRHKIFSRHNIHHVEKFESDIDPNHIIDQYLMRQKVLSSPQKLSLDFGPSTLTQELIKKLKMAIKIISLHYNHDQSEDQ